MVSLDAILVRAFRAANGEIGVVPADAIAYIDACRSHGVEMDGWELWLVDHATDASGETIARAKAWTGLLPVRGAAAPTVVGGAGDAEECSAQIGALDLESMFEPQWRPFLRINFAMDV